jgi:hypothetical protein
MEGMTVIEQWVRTALAPHVQGNEIVLATYADGSTKLAVEISTFVELFASVTEPTYDNLVAADGGTMGYKPYFDQWKAEGLVQ